MKYFMNDSKTGYPSIDKPWLNLYSKGIGDSPYKGNIYNHILDKNKYYLTNIALRYFGRKITYGNLFNAVDRVANSLYSYGIRKGDNVALLMLSCPELVYLVLALNKIGAVANMINPLFDEKQIKDRINDTEANLLIVIDQLYSRIENIRAELSIKDTVVIPLECSMPTLTRIIAHQKLKKNISYTNSIWEWDKFITKFNNDATGIEDSNDEELPAIMVYSSGTTGASKGIVLINKGINATIGHYENSGFEYERKESYLQIIPTWFSTGIVFCLLMPLSLGLSVIIEPVFNEENFAKDILKYKPNMVMGPTSLWLHALKVFDKNKKDLSFITYPITGGEKVLPETESMLNGVLKRNGCNKHLVTGYGMCELGSTATATSMEHWKLGTAGYPILGVTVAAFNPDTNEECKYNECGEIRVLTTSRMKEYYKRPDATADFFWEDLQGNEWGCTGDIGYVDEDGFVFVQGRASDFFVNKCGEHIYCFDVEDEILKIEQVYQCEVIGVPTEDGYDTPVAFVVLKDCVADCADCKKLIEAYCAENIGENYRPEILHIIDEFPVKGSGKRDMEKLMEMAKEILLME